MLSMMSCQLKSISGCGANRRGAKSLLLVAAIVVVATSLFAANQVVDANDSFSNFYELNGYVVSTAKLPEHYTSHFDENQDEKSLTKMHKVLKKPATKLFGYIDDLPGIPGFLKSANFRSSVTIYTPGTPKGGIKIILKPTQHLQLKDPEFDLEDFIDANDLELPETKSDKVFNLLKDKISSNEEYPMDLFTLAQTKFNSSQNTRIVIGGYMSSENSRWINEIVGLWRKLDPQSNIIKFSWDEGNHGTYQSAAFNSRLAGRQLGVFMYYLDQIFHLDHSKFHIVGHSLGAQIAGVVGYETKGKIARITGLDPAGPKFRVVPSRYRLSPEDAEFVDVIHTNAGLSLTSGSLGLEAACGHVDYYANGGFVQPGCLISSLGRLIANPVCSHSRSHEYFIELLRMEIDRRAGKLDPNITWPLAYLVEKKSGNILKDSVVQPEVIAIKYDTMTLRQILGLPPVKLDLEVTNLKPKYPRNKKGIYIFNTRALKPYFQSKQYVFTLKTSQTYGRTIYLVASIKGSQLFKGSLKLSGTQSIVFAVDDYEMLEKLFKGKAKSETAPIDLWWRVTGLSLMPLKAIQVESIEIRALEKEANGESLVLRYNRLQHIRPATEPIGDEIQESTHPNVQVTSVVLGETQGPSMLREMNWHRLAGNLLIE